MPKTKLDIDILMIKQCVKIEFFFFNSKRYNSIKNQTNLDIIVINLYIKFQFNMYNHSEIEQKLLVDWPTDIQTAPKQLACPSSKGGGHKKSYNKLAILLWYNLLKPLYIIYALEINKYHSQISWWKSPAFPHITWNVWFFFQCR